MAMLREKGCVFHGLRKSALVIHGMIGTGRARWLNSVNLMSRMGATMPSPTPLFTYAASKVGLEL